MNANEVIQLGNSLQVKFVVTNYNMPYSRMCSPEYVINSVALFQVQVIVSQVNNGHTNVYYNLIFVRFMKIRPIDDLTYTIKLNSNELSLSDKTFSTDEGSFHLISELKKQQYTLDINVQMEIACHFNSFASLHDDEELTDFEMRGEDGSVYVHKVVLAAASPVLRRMLCGKWRETAEGHVDIPGASRETLQNLKNYVYCHILPEKGLEQLLLLASYYMMPALELKCVDKLVKSLTAENAFELLEFAAKNKVTQLLLSILESVQNKSIKVDDMREFIMRDELISKSDVASGSSCSSDK